MNRLTLGGWLAVLAVVILNGPHTAVCRSQGKRSIVWASDNATLGWPWMFRGHQNEIRWFDRPIFERPPVQQVLSVWTYHHLRPLRLLLDLGFAFCTMAAVEFWSRRAGRRYSLRTLLVGVAIASVLMGVTIRWDYRAAATVLACGIIVSAVAIKLRERVARRASTLT